MKTKLNPKEAPKGHIAVENEPQNMDKCNRCALSPFLSPGCLKAECSDLDRKDKINVYFVKAPKRPRHKATFERWWKTQERKHPWLTNTHVDKYANACEQIARRAYAAGRRRRRRRSMK